MTLLASGFPNDEMTAEPENALLDRRMRGLEILIGINTHSMRGFERERR